jgi:hypothetical protein
MNILDKIIAQKRLEVAERKAQTSIAVLEQGKFYLRNGMMLIKIMQKLFLLMVECIVKD